MSIARDIEQLHTWIRECKKGGMVFLVGLGFPLKAAFRIFEVPMAYLCRTIKFHLSKLFRIHFLCNIQNSSLTFTLII